MPHQKLKSENYVQMGGINIKASPYITGPHQFLDLVNFDFIQPGSLTKRWGSTQYMSVNVPPRQTGMYEYERIDGTSQIIVVGSTIAYQIVSSQSLGIIRSTQSIATQGSNQITSVSTYVMGASLNYDFETFSNLAFASNGRNFWKYDGSTTYYYSLPRFIPFVPLSVSMTGLSGFGNPDVTLGFNFRFAFLSKFGHLSPGSLLSVETIGGTVYNTVTFSSPQRPFHNIPENYGITAIGIYARLRTDPDVPSNYVFIDFLNLSLTTYAYPSAGIQDKVLGTNTVLFLQNDIGINNERLPDYLDFPAWGITGAFLGDLAGANTMSVVGVTVNSLAQTFAPKYLEIYNNQLMMAGITGVPSNLVFSDIGLPEAVPPENFIEFRTNDGDMIRAIKSYNSKFYVFKERSFHELSGTDSTNFSVQEISDQYGCLSNRAVAIYNDIMLFLDRKGVVRFNGANLEVISTPVENIFLQMNVSAARENATMIHDKARNQILIGIPYQGSTLNNLTVVYDYFSNAWTKYEGFNPSDFQQMQGRLTERSIFYMNYSGRIHNFGQSFLSDNGEGFTCYLKTRYLHDLGQSVEKQFRRLYLNVDPLVGVTSAFNINFFVNYGSSVALNRAMYQNPFQSRIDFGLPGKSLAFELSNFSSTDSIKLHGYTIEYRFQRAV